MFVGTVFALAGCAPKLGGLDVSYGYAEALPLVQPSTDTRRWYVPMHTESLGPVVWFIDTGYTYTTCDDGLADALGLLPTGRVLVRGELGELEANKVVLPSMSLGGHTLDDLVCVVRDLNATSSLDDPIEVPIAGVLGMDVLEKFRVRIDPSRGALTLVNPDQMEPLALGDEGVSPLKRKGLRARVGLHVNGQEIWPILDTGASHTYLDGERLGLRPVRVAEAVEVRGTGVSGTQTRRVVSYAVDEAAVGTWSVEPLTVNGRAHRFREPGLVGLDLLQQFEQDYDFAHGLMRLSPVDEPGDLPQFSHWWPTAALVPARLSDQGLPSADAAILRGPRESAFGRASAAGEAEAEPR